MRFARWVFLIAGIYGLVTVVPQYGLERLIAERTGPITHPEYFYGFLGVIVAFQLVFLTIARDPARLRPIMPACVVEKLSFGIAGWALFHAHRIGADVVFFASIDLVLAVLFATAWIRVAQETRG
jgi:hypothetical protein